MARKEKKYHFIYKTTNTLSGKYYYGMHSTDNLEDGYLGSGRRLRYSINKYGEENHIREIIEFCRNRKELIAREKEIVNLNEIAKDECINLMVGGAGGLISEEHHKKMRIGASKWIKKMWDDDEYRKKMSKVSSESMKKKHKDGKIKYDTFTGKKHSNETISLMKEKKNGHGVGEKNSQFGTCWITNGTVSKKINKNDILPKGWKYGRK